MLAVALTAVRVRRWPSFGSANIDANVLHVNAFQATVPGEAVSSGSAGARGKRKPMALYSFVKVKLALRAGLHAASAMPPPLAALSEAAGPSGVVQVEPRQTSWTSEYSALAVFRGPDSHASAAQLAERFAALPTPSIEAWPTQWEVRHPVLVQSQTAFAVPATHDLTNVTFKVQLPKYTLDSFTAAAQGSLLDAFARLSKSESDSGPRDL